MYPMILFNHQLINMKESKLNIQLTINEHGLTPDVTNIHCNLSLPVTTPSISMSRKQYTLGTTGRLIRNNYTGNKDKMLYIKNIGKTNFSITSTTTADHTEGEVFGALASGDVTLFRLKEGYNLYLTNLSSTGDGQVEYAYWECKESV